MSSTHELTIIPGLINFVKTGEIDELFKKYYFEHKYSTKANEKYSIIRYDKDYLSTDLVPVYGLLRSVIFSGPKLVCFAPPKSISGETFIKNYPTKTPNIIAQDFIEGTMINVFYDPMYGANGCWQISTRNTVGAEVSFYTGTTKTFNEMFMDACIETRLNIQTLNPRFCYSFVLQHPENRIVVPFKIPRLYLVAVYEIIQTENNINVIEEKLSEVRSCGLWNLTGIRFPDTYEFTTYTELIEKFASPNTPYDIVGIVVKNLDTGERTKFRNPIYEEVRHLRGNQPKLQYQYLSLRHAGKLPEFFKYYPETKHQMSKFRDQLHMFTKTLHQNYLDCYVKKTKQLKEYSSQYRTHMFALHAFFINELRPNKHIVTNTIVNNYVNKMQPSLLMHCLNHNMRKRTIDTLND